MEDVLDVYSRPYDPQHPLVGMDEVSKQLLADLHPKLPVAQGHPERYDYEYERNGTCNLFMFFAPLEGWREVKVTTRRTMIDWAHAVRELLDVHFPAVDKITLVMDNLNTHTPASFYAAFDPAEARRLTEKLEIHYTPKHGSWLNIAEIELAVLERQCLEERIPDLESMRACVEPWVQERNQAKVKADWQFNTEDARIKLKKLYPAI